MSNPLQKLEDLANDVHKLREQVEALVIAGKQIVPAAVALIERMSEIDQEHAKRGGDSTHS